ncbi:MAG: hypothetical protein GTN76_08195 [Candidatus Aenigmarchaeota archaeon]|nr:hypothetical protein [Candidatus Aenigmarchaeota archaeon]
MSNRGSVLYDYAHKIIGDGVSKEDFFSDPQVSELIKDDFLIITNLSACLEMSYLILRCFLEVDDIYKSFIRIFREALRSDEHKGNALYYYASLHAYMNIESQYFFSDPHIEELLAYKMETIADPVLRHKLTALILFKYYDYSLAMNDFYLNMKEDIEVSGEEKLLYEWEDREFDRTHIVLKTFCQYDECMQIHFNRLMSLESEVRYRDEKYDDRAVLWTEAFFRPYYQKRGGIGVDIGCADAPLLAASELIDLAYGSDMLDMSSYSFDTYDWVHCSQAIEHIRKDQAEDLIDKMKARIERGGYFFLSTPSPSCFEFNSDLQSESNPLHLWQPSMEQIIAMFDRVGGYECIDYQIGYPFYDAFVFQRQ